MPKAARELGLNPHPEGGWYRRTYTSPVTVETTNGTRPAATMIYFFLSKGETSAWHVVDSDEIWLWHGPGKLALQLGGIEVVPEETSPISILGPQRDGFLGQLLVPAGTWQRSLPGTDDVLVSCLVSPGFSFEDWRLAD